MDSQTAVKAVIQNPEGKYLILREGKRWQAVGGLLEAGESPLYGLRREIREETGITEIKVGEVIHTDQWVARLEGEEKLIVAQFYSCKVKTGQLVVLSGEHNAYAWTAPSELYKYGGSIEPEIRRAIALAAASGS